MGQEKLYIEKELSWLSFNERVLQEAADKSNPLIERMRFLGIYSNNLDEFYKVRFAELKRRIIISEEQMFIATRQVVLQRADREQQMTNKCQDVVPDGTGQQIHRLLIPVLIQ